MPTESHLSRIARPTDSERGFTLVEILVALLIIGIACKQLPVTWNLIPVGIAGVIHGVLFLVYCVAVVALAPSLGWGWFKTIVAGLFSVPPYGTLVFEQYAARQRDWTDMKHLHRTVRYQSVVTDSAK